MKRSAAVDLGALGLLAALALGLCWPFVLGGKAFYYYDTGDLVMPLLHWSHQLFSIGLTPAWDGSTLCGISQVDSSISACLYPPLRLFAVLADARLAIGLTILFHLTLAAWGAYALVRSRGLSPGPALLGALTAAFSGGMLNQPTGWPVFVSLTWFPWMLLGLFLCQDAAPRWRRLGSAVLGLSTGLGFLGGYPGMGFYALLLLALFHGFWLVEKGRRRGEVARAWAALALAVAVALLLYGGQAALLRRGAGQSTRGGGLSVGQAEEGSLSPATAAGLVLPHALGRRANDSFSGASWRFGTYEPTGVYLYLGLGPLLLLGLALVRRRRDSAPYAVAWGLLVFYALGRWNPLYPWILRLPVFGFLRAPDKAVFLGGTLACLPVAWGLQAAVEIPNRGAWRFAAGLALALGLALAALHLEWGRLMRAGDAHIQARILGNPLHRLSAAAYQGRLLRFLGNLRWHLAVQAVWAGLLALGLWLGRRWRLGAGALALLLLPIIFGDLATNARAQWLLIDRSYYQAKPACVAWLQARQDPDDPSRTLSWGYLASLRRIFPEGRPEGRLPQELALKEALLPNTQRWWSLDLSDGYAPLRPKRIGPLLGWIQAEAPTLPGEDGRRLRAARRALDLSATRWVVSSVPLDLPGLALRRGGDVRIYENLRVLPMAYVADRSRGGYSSASAWAALSDPRSAEAQWLRPALLEDASKPLRGHGSVRWISKSDNAWDLQVQVDSADGVLVLSRAYYPGPWKASVDGVGADLLPVNAAFCALHLGPGLHRVRVYYDDPLLALAWRLELAGLLLTVALLLWAWRGRQDRA